MIPPATSTATALVWLASLWLQAAFLKKPAIISSDLCCVAPPSEGQFEQQAELLKLELEAQFQTAEKEKCVASSSVLTLVLKLSVFIDCGLVLAGLVICGGCLRCGCPGRQVRTARPSRAARQSAEPVEVVSSAPSAESSPGEEIVTPAWKGGKKGGQGAIRPSDIRAVARTRK
jgi:hypothetical protein